MKVELEVTDSMVDEILVHELSWQLAMCMDSKDWYMEEDDKYNKMMTKALKKVLRHNTSPDQYKRIIKDIKKGKIA